VFLDGKLFVYEGSELLDDFSINNGDEETRVENGNKNEGSGKAGVHREAGGNSRVAMANCGSGERVQQ
jgi:hypothetical protein